MMAATTRAVVVQWCDDATMMAAAKAAGWDEDSAASILDLVDEDIATKAREFPSITKAKEWARRNKALDFWRQPAIKVYEWPNARRRDHERERVQFLRYVGDGLGWEDVE
jgi:hypothetical protein